MTKFSVFLPVHNGWPFVKDCVKSILNQTCSDIELHVLENCSTDYTVQWLEELKDPRVKIWPSKEKLSIVENWNMFQKSQLTLSTSGHSSTAKSG